MKALNTKKTATLLTVISLTLTGMTVVASAEGKVENDALSVTKASISMEQAIKAAKQAVPGVATMAKFSTDDGKGVWEVELVDASHQTFDVDIDAGTGDVLKQEVDKADREDDDEDHSD